MHDKLKTFKANKSNRRLICYFLWNKDRRDKEESLLFAPKILTQKIIIMKEHQILIDELLHLLNGGNAHADLNRALKDLPANLRGAKPDKLPYSIWQLVEHIRIAQWDMLEFSKDGSHESPNWPDDYWPKETAPESDEAWNKSVKQIKLDQDELAGLIKTGDLYSKIPHGDGQTILREALQVADHNAYHVAEIIVIRRLLGAW
jgi:hypothetical protein